MAYVADRVAPHERVRRVEFVSEIPRSPSGGTFLCARAILPAMAARGAGRIVNITSEAGVFRWPQVSAYSVSKAAVIKFTENLAAEAGRHGVQVFSVHPGITPIGLSERALADGAPPGSAEARAHAWIRGELRAGRGADPALAARLVTRLAAGHVDQLSGCHLSVHDDLDAIVAGGPGGRHHFQLRLQGGKISARGLVACY